MRCTIGQTIGRFILRRTLRFAANLERSEKFARQQRLAIALCANFFFLVPVDWQCSIINMPYFFFGLLTMIYKFLFLCFDHIVHGVIESLLKNDRIHSLFQTKKILFMHSRYISKSIV